MYNFVVEYWDEMDQEPRTESGLVSADSYSEAIEKITEYFGENNIISIKSYVVEPIMTEEEILDMFETETED